MGPVKAAFSLPVALLAPARARQAAVRLSAGDGAQGRYQRFFLSMVPRQFAAPQWHGKRRFTAGVCRSWVTS